MYVLYPLLIVVNMPIAHCFLQRNPFSRSFPITGESTASVPPSDYRKWVALYPPAFFNTLSALSVTHLLGCFFGPKSTQVLPV